MTEPGSISAFETSLKIFLDFVEILPDKAKVQDYRNRLARSGCDRALARAKSADAARRSSEQRIAEIESSKQATAAEFERKKIQAVADLENQKLSALDDLDKAQNRTAAELEARESELTDALAGLSTVMAALEELKSEVFITIHAAQEKGAA